MGVVYRAYDPRLQREVALKCVRAGTLSEENQRRMILEAQSMAKLSHPNVVAVYDVEMEGDQVMLSMELVDGQTLREWIKDGPHEWPRVVELLRGAGRGLAAAHEAGIIHRDFKPGNVLIGADGRARVTDFGLARIETQPDPSLPSHQGTDPSGSSEGLTEAGQVMGTPAYMAPEQHTASELGPSADQYAYCVSLWYALTGERPFGPGSFRELAEAKSHGPPAFPRIVPSVPAPIVSAIRRGLAPLPRDRWASMEDLLQALEFDSGAARRRWTRYGAGGSIVVLGALAYVGWNKGPADACADLAQRHLDEVWGAQARARVTDAMLAVGTSYAPSVAERVAASLDIYAQEWISSRVDACEASTVRREQSAAAMDLRMACLDRAKVDLQATVAVLEQVDRTTLQRADDLVAALPSLGPCADVEALMSETPPPSDPEVAASVWELRRDLADARALYEAGKFGEADELVTSLLSRARALEYAPLRTEVELVEGQTARSSADYPRAEQRLRSALRRGLRWGQWNEALQASQELTDLLSRVLARHFEARSVAEVALGLDGRDEIDVQSRADTLEMLGTTDVARGDLAAAREHVAEALDLRRSVLAEDAPTVLDTRRQLAGIHHDMGELELAETEFRALLDLRKQRLGPTHPAVAQSINDLAVVLLSQARYDEAESLLQRALTLRVEGLGPDHPRVADTRINLGELLVARGDLSGAEEEFRAALELYEQAVGTPHAQAAVARTNLAAVLYKQGRFAAAEREYRAALEISLATLPVTHPDVADGQHNIGLMLTIQEKPREAIEMFRKAEPTLVQSFGPDHPKLGQLHSSLALAHLSLGELRDAEREIVRSIEIRKEKLGPLHNETAMSRTNYAIILKETGELDEARDQLALAIEGYTESLGPDHPDTGGAYANLGDVLRELGRLDDATEAYMSAMKILEPSLGEMHVRTSQAYEGLAYVAREQGRRKDARRWFEKNWAVMKPMETYGAARARAALDLARALWPEQRSRALELATEAVETLEDLQNELAPEGRAWLESHS
jgi:tetratricopeptide (TPR) repeat protein